MTDAPPVFPAAQRWADALAAWAIPPEILERAPASPWAHDPRRFAVDDQLDRDTTSAMWAREVLPPVGGTVIDVGCGGGRSAVPLAPPATELVGVDRSPEMLESFVVAAAAAGTARRTVCGEWPDVADVTPVGDVVVCHHVVYNVAEIAPFVAALTRHARLAVVVELADRHPMTAWAPAWRHFWGVARPAGPTADDFVAVIRELGLDPEVSVARRGPTAVAADDPTLLVDTTCRRLCLPLERAEEVRSWLAEHPPPFPERVATLRWPGAAEPES